MPDYNPAVATSIQTPQNNFTGTLGAITNIQENAARTGLIQLQAAQQMRQFNALQAAAAAYRSGGDMVGAYVGSGGAPEGANAMQTLQANRDFMSRNHGMLPQGLEATASASANFARAANEKAQLPGFQAGSEQKNVELRGSVSQSLYTDTSDDNWKAQLPTMVGHVSPQGWSQLMDAYAHPEKREGVAKSMMAAAMPPAEANKPQAVGVDSNVITPLGQMANRGAATAGGGAPNTPQSVETQKKFAEENSKDLAEANEQFRNANTAQLRLGDLRKNLNNLGGFLEPGTGFNERVAVARAMDTAGINLGFTKDQLASAQASIKGSTYLGFDLARTLGSREAQMIVQQSIGVQPGGQLTPEGNKRVWAALSVANQYNKDHASFVQQYLKQNPNAVPGDADQAFSQAHPVGDYIRDVDNIVKIQGDKNKSGGYLVDDLNAGRGSADEFNKHYGGNYARYFGSSK